MKLTTRPMTDRAWIGAKPRTRSQFTATYSDTLQLLEREVHALQTRGMDDPVLMFDITEAALEALRAVDRYGATQSGEQYVGYRQIEARRVAVHTTAVARDALFALVGDSVPFNATDTQLVKVARRETHPDRPGGSREAWDRVEQAAKVLGVQP